MVHWKKRTRPDGRELKWQACRRLKKEGRYEEFAKRKGEIMKDLMRTYRDAAFYAALKEFPPL